MLGPAFLFVFAFCPAATDAAPPNESVEWVETSRPVKRGPNRDAEYRRVRMPTYPSGARASGTVTLRVVVDEQGKTTFVIVDSSSGDTALDEAAQAVVREWSFWPELKDGKPIATTLFIPIVFTYRDSQK